jgi:DNA recombination protein RmuC
VVGRLREDHGEALRLLREEGAATLEAVRAEGRRTAEELRSVRAELSALTAEHSAHLRGSEERESALRAQIEQLRGVREEMTKEFQRLAAATLRDTGAQFSEAHQAKLTELLTPFREQVNRFEAELREVHSTAKVDRELLARQIMDLTSKTDAVSQEALNLTRALKGDKQRQGAWGEVRLEEYLVHMGLQRDVHYFVQPTRRDEDGNDYRPDFILKMPDGKCIVLDSKVSLVSYAAAMDAATEEERAGHLRDHVAAVRSHIKLLSEKAYQRLEQGSVNWVMMFMPIEGAISAAWTHEADIGTYAMDRNIGIAYPTTLLMALKTFDQLWKIEQRNRNADRIADRAGKLFDKFALVVESFRKVGTSIDAARGAHAEAMGRLNDGSGNLGWQINELKKLGAKTTKSLALSFDDDAPGKDGEEPRIVGLPGPEGDGPRPTHGPGAVPAE